MDVLNFFIDSHGCGDYIILRQVGTTTNKKYIWKSFSVILLVP